MITLKTHHIAVKFLIVLNSLLVFQRSRITLFFLLGDQLQGCQ